MHATYINKFPLIFGISLTKEQAICWIKIDSLGGVGILVLALALQTRRLPCFPNSVRSFPNSEMLYMLADLSKDVLASLFENVDFFIVVCILGKISNKDN